MSGCITVETGNWEGGQSLTLWEDGRALLEETPSHGDARRHERAAPGAYAAAVALIRAHGPMRPKPPGPLVLDFGRDLVRAEPAIDGISEWSSDQPDRRLEKLIQRLFGLVTP